MASVSKLLMREAVRDGVTILIVDGGLDATTYLRLRNRIINAALDEPAAVVVNISALRVPSPSAYSAFTSARWHVSRWPDVPVLLVCGHATGRAALHREGVTRWVPVSDRLDAALAAVDDIGVRSRLRKRVELLPELDCVRLARELINEWLWDWGHGDKIKAAMVIAAELVENVYAHTDSVGVLRVEAEGPAVTIAVSDHSDQLATRIESTHESFRLSGLHVVAALADEWGCVPSTDGKTVWATLI